MEDQAITQRLNILTPEYKEFVLSVFIEEISKVFSSEENFTDRQETLLHNGFSLFLLLFLNVEDLILFIEKNCGVPHQKAKEISGVFFASLPEGLLLQQSGANQEITETSARQSSIEDTNTSSTNDNQPMSQSDILKG
jgi:hypothetical protein